jgi:hypothetical protein
VFRTDALENVLVFLSVKAAQGILTEDIDSKVLAYLVPELQRHPGVVVCGEGTSVLWGEGKADAAIRVEQGCIGTIGELGGGFPEIKERIYNPSHVSAAAESDDPQKDRTVQRH